jgi:hypothetical protein
MGAAEMAYNRGGAALAEAAAQCQFNTQSVRFTRPYLGGDSQAAPRVRDPPSASRAALMLTPLACLADDVRVDRRHTDRLHLSCLQSRCLDALTTITD